MNENTTQIVIDSLAETIKNLRVEVIILKSENDRLREENKRFAERLIDKEAKNNA